MCEYKREVYFQSSCDNLYISGNLYISDNGDNRIDNFNCVNNDIDKNNIDEKNNVNNGINDNLYFDDHCKIVINVDNLKRILKCKSIKLKDKLEYCISIIRFYRNRNECVIIQGDVSNRKNSIKNGVNLNNVNKEIFIKNGVNRNNVKNDLSIQNEINRNKFIVIKDLSSNITNTINNNILSNTNESNRNNTNTSIYNNTSSININTFHNIIDATLKCITNYSCTNLSTNTKYLIHALINIIFINKETIRKDKDCSYIKYISGNEIKDEYFYSSEINQRDLLQHVEFNGNNFNREGICERDSEIFNCDKEISNKDSVISNEDNSNKDNVISNGDNEILYNTSTINTNQSNNNRNIFNTYQSNNNIHNNTNNIHTINNNIST
ncbi:hypothetical protein NAPIS_ORF02459 [Vairimorpha apis BRL 01]|uniref:Uncharacterized protein n=1 Tax=Vairimorpha apis BRL 01 TaxID=1037528 RepID=T0KX91_9MICR|nr:hypothetical protein NAPIS_ORF02459 [Vairimorpha apis BRL 01]